MAPVEDTELAGRVSFSYKPGEVTWSFGDDPAVGNDFMIAFEDTSISGRILEYTKLDAEWVHIALEVPQSQRDEVLSFADWVQRSGTEVAWG